MANTNLDIILSSMGRSQDPGYDDILSGMGGSQPGGPIVISLNALLLSSTSFLTGGATSVGILNKTAGSAIAATSSDGTALSVSGSTLTGSFTAAGTPNITLVETLAGATNSPRTSVVGITVAAASATTPPLNITVADSYYEPEARTLFTAMDAVGTTPLAYTAKYDMNRRIKRMKASGIWDKLSWYVVAANLPQNEAQARINWKDPTKTLAKVGTPTWTATVGFGSAAAGSNYTTDTPLSAVNADSFHMHAWTPAAASGSAVLCGAQDANGNGLQIIPSNSSTLMAARAMGPSTTGAASTNNYNGRGAHTVNRLGTDIGAGLVAFCRNGGRVESVTPTTAPAVISDGALLAVAGATNNASAPAQTVGVYSHGLGLTRDQEDLLSALSNDINGPAVRGKPKMYDAGIGGNVQVDIAVLGTSLPAIVSAYEAKRQNPNLVVAIFADEDQTQAWHLGGHTAQGLGWSDVYNGAIYSGAWWEMVRWVKEVFYSGSSPSRTAGFTSQFQTGTSAEGRAWNAACRRMLDPTQTGGLIPGLDIPVFWDKGYTAVTVSNAAISSFTTAAGRTVQAKVVIGNDYNGIFPKLANIPAIKGSEATGTGKEANAGYNGPPNYLPLVQSTNIKVSPYKTPGDSTSGLVRGVVPLPTLAVGSADPDSIQSMNIRQAWVNATTSLWRAVRDRTTQPTGTDLEDMEILARVIAQGTAQGLTFNLADLYNPTGTPTIANTTYDINNGKCRVATNYIGSGTRWANAANPVARRTELLAIANFILKLKAWTDAGTDSRIPASFKALSTTYYRDALSYTDVEPDYYLWLGEPYKREPINRLQSSFVWNANDISTTDGQPIRTAKPIAAMSYYGYDKHGPRRVPYDDGSGVAVWIQGGHDDNTNSGGADKTSVMPFEAVMPDKGVCTNFLTATYPSLTSTAFCFYRMEPAMAMTAQALGVIAALAVANNIAVQDVSYSDFTAAVATGYSVPLVIPASTSTGATTPAPSVTTVPSISPTSGTAGSTTFTGTDAVVSNGTVSSRVWLLSGTAIGSGTTVTPASAGSLVFRNSIDGTDGSTITSDSTAVTVAAATSTPTPTPTPTPTGANDSFTGTSGTALSAHTANSGQAWSKLTTNDFTLDGSGGVYGTSPIKATLAWTPDSANYYVRGTFHMRNLLANPTGGVIGRVQDVNTMYLFGIRTSTGGWTLMKYSGSTTLTSIGNVVAYTPAAGDTHVLELNMVGTTLVGKVDGVAVCTATDSDIAAAGKAGLAHLAGSTTATDGVHYEAFSTGAAS